MNRHYLLYKEQHGILIKSYKLFICKSSYFTAKNFEEALSDFNILARRAGQIELSIPLEDYSVNISPPLVIYLSFLKH